MTQNSDPSPDETRSLPLLAKSSVPAAAASVHALPVGARLAEFEIERLLGEGGFGIVYLARDLRLERQVALKEYMPGSLAGRAADLSVTVRSERDRSTFELGLRSFVNEARLLAQLDHPALVKVLRFWEERGTAYMVMPYYVGRTLKQVVSGRLAPDEAWLRALIEPLLDVLAYLHSQHIYHRDVSPENILLLPDGRPLLLDFGAARLIVSDATQNLTAILKPGYAPVEQYADSGVSKQGAWTDVYALAAVLYFVIGGKAPPPSVARLMNDDMPSAVQVGQGRYSTAFLQGIDACLTVRPEQRPRDVAAARYLLSASAGQSTVFGMDAATLPELVSAAAVPAGAAEVGVAPPRRPRWGWAAFGLTIAVGGVGVAWVMRPGGAPAPRGDVPAAQVPAPVAAPPAPVPAARVEAPVDAGANPKAQAAEPDSVASTPPLVKAPGTAPAIPRTESQQSATQCAELLQRLSLGEDSEALRQKLVSLRCR